MRTHLTQAHLWAYVPGDAWKFAGDLLASDVGRECEYGFIECIEHGKERTVIALADGTLQYLHPEERIGLYVREPEGEYGR